MCRHGRPGGGLQRKGGAVRRGRKWGWEPRSPRSRLHRLKGSLPQTRKPSADPQGARFSATCQDTRVGTLRNDHSGGSDGPHPHTCSSTPREAEAVPVTEARDSSFPQPPQHTHTTHTHTTHTHNTHTHPPTRRAQHLWSTVLVHLN